jgi:hypothetical protein
MVVGRDVIGRGHMKDAFLMLVVVGFAGGFAYLTVYSAMEYYTTWALATHSAYFAAFVLGNLFFGDVLRWGCALPLRWRCWSSTSWLRNGTKCLMIIVSTVHNATIS